jgi:hypothetical protein
MSTPLVVKPGTPAAFTSAFLNNIVVSSSGGVNKTCNKWEYMSKKNSSNSKKNQKYYL